MRRRRPALGLAEEVDEALARGRIVIAPSRLDVDLRRQRDREDLALRGLGDAQPEAQRGRGRVLDDLGAEHGELGRDRRRRAAAGGQALGFARGAHAPCRSSEREELGHGVVDRAPAGDALPARLDHAHELVAAVDRHDRVARRLAHAVDDQRLDLGLELAQTGFAATSSSQAARCSSLSVAPAGLG